MKRDIGTNGCAELEATRREPWNCSTAQRATVQSEIGKPCRIACSQIDSRDANLSRCIRSEVNWQDIDLVAEIAIAQVQEP